MNTRARSVLRSLVVAAATATVIAVPGSAQAADAPGTATAGMAASPSYTWIAESITAGDVDWYKFVLPAGRWTNVILGDLTADLRLDLYDAKLKLLRSSNVSGTQFEDMLVPLPQGTFFVRVMGVTASTRTTSPYVVRFQPRAQGVYPTNVYAHNDENGAWRVTGEVLNNTPGWVTAVRVQLSYYDAKGNLVAAYGNRTVLPLIGPRRVGPWQAAIHTPPQQFSRYVVHVLGYTNTTANTNGVTAAITATKNSRTSRQYSGVVTNARDVHVVDVRVAGTYYDARTRVLKIQTVDQPENEIPAKGTWAFTWPAGKPLDNRVGLTLPARAPLRGEFPRRLKLPPQRVRGCRGVPARARWPRRAP